MLKKILILSDNEFLMKRIEEIICEKKINTSEIDFGYSEKNKNFKEKVLNNFSVSPVNVKRDCNLLIENYNLIISLHCKQIFPELLVKNVKCINVHPGYNPYNRGWYPQVFSIINGLPLGVTIHEMDEFVDHGPIIARRQVELFSWDTSISAYNRVLKTEIKLLEENLEKIILGNYTTFLPENEGNVNTKKRFAEICELDLTDVNSLESHINLLRSLSHGEFKNAYFIDKKTGRKHFIRVTIDEL